MPLAKILRNAVAIGLIGLTGPGSSYKNDDCSQKEELRKVAYNPETEAMEITSTGYDYLRDRGVPKDVASRYSEEFRLSLDNIVYLYGNSISPEEANNYAGIMEQKLGLWMNQRERMMMRKEIIDGKVPYVAQCSAMIYKTLIDAGITPDKFAKYDSRFFSDPANNIIALAEANVKPEFANRYSRLFCAEDIAYLVSNKIDPETANRYAELKKKYRAKIDVNLIKDFVYSGISHEEAEKKILNSNR